MQTPKFQSKIIISQNPDMDYWFSWLSKTGMDRSLVYEYGLMFLRNELEEEDKKFFNHEFLQSMGISVAKHRLEILKLVKKEVGDSPHRGLSLFLAINRAKRCISKSIGKRAFLGETAHAAGLKATQFRTHWSEALRKQSSSKEFNIEKVRVTNRSPMWSGPMDRRVQERLMMVTNRSRVCVSGPLDEKPSRLMSINKSPTASGPLDGRVQDRFLFPNKSPDLSWPCDVRDSSPIKVNNSHHGKEKMDGGNGVQPLWSFMFQDMKPT